MIAELASMQPGTALACVDIGGSKISVRIASASGLGEPRIEEPARKGRPDAVALQVIAMIEQSLAQAGVAAHRMLGVGVASTGPFVRRDGALQVVSPNLCGGMAGAGRGLPNDWTAIPLEAPLAQRFGHVRMANDAVAALAAERRWGALKGFDDCAYVTWSTGVGTGLCVGGQVLVGRNGNAGHAGHSFVDSGGQSLCGCGNIGDVEAMVGGNALQRMHGVAPKVLFDAAAAGQAHEQAIVADACDVFERLLFNLVATLDLQRIALGGALFWHNREHLLPHLRAGLASRPHAFVDGVEIVPCGLGLQVGDYGALAVALPV